MGVSAEGKSELTLTADALTLTDKQDQTMVHLVNNGQYQSGVLVNGPGNAFAVLGYNLPAGMFPGPGFLVRDKEGYTAALGPVSLKNPGTGTQERRSAASLLLSDNDGKVIWSAP
jgi:hypothetical protein